MNRRDFLKLSGAVLGGAVLACGGGSKLIELTAAPSQNPILTPPPPTLAAGEVADAILVNGNIVTMDAKKTITKALAVKNGIILFVGDEPAVRNMAGGGTQVIDLTGRTATPGMIDAHCHLSACGLLGRPTWTSVGRPSKPSRSCRQRSRNRSPGHLPANGWLVRDG